MGNAEKMKFVFPCKDYEQKAIAYIQEFYDYNSPINGVGGLNRFLEDSSYAQWLAKVNAGIDLANIPEGNVPGYTYFYVREADDEIVGMINIRLALLTDFLRKEGGHIGYSIRPAQRGKGYGTRMLQETLAFCGNIGLKEFILTCDQSNRASAGVIKNCGGVLEAEFYSEFFKQVIQRYRIRK